MTYSWKHAVKAAGATPPRRQTRAVELQSQVGRILEQARLAVIYAGDKSVEGSVIHPTSNPRSWKSYEAVAHDIAAALGRLGCRQVSVIPEDMRLATRLRDERIDMAWLNSGGVQGYDSLAHAPSLLEMLGIPYVGHSPLAAATLDNKYVFKKLLVASAIPTPPCVIWQAGDGIFNSDTAGRFKLAFANWHGAFIVKPISGRASLNVQYVAERRDLGDVIASVQAASGNCVLVEGYLPGREYCVAASGHVVSKQGVLERHDAPFTFACVERMLDDGEKIFTSMDVKAITVDRVRLLRQTEQDSEVAERLRELGRRVFVELGLETLVRLDVRAGEDGKLYILEANPKPDLKAQRQHVTSIICASLAQEGMDFDDLVLSLLADRIDILFSERRASAATLLDLAA